MGRRQIERFARAILAGAPASPDFVDGARAQAVMDAAERSQTEGGWADVHMEET
jgi:predicted dehydrogenase